MKAQKSIFLSILAIVAIIWTVSAKEITPNAKIKTAFEKKFSNTKNLVWEKGTNGDFLASFDTEDGAVEAAFAKDGSWLYTKTEIWQETLPEVIQEYLEEEYADATIMSTMTYEDPATTLEYILTLSIEEELEVEEEDWEQEIPEPTYLKLTFDEQGEFLSEETIDS